MEFTVPDGRRYAESHEWAEPREDAVRVGVTDFAQDELGDVVFVELPAPGETLDEGEAFGVVESIKAVSDVYAPVAGEVVAVNDAVVDQPELLNEAPFEDGWLVEIAADGDLAHLLDAAAYRDQIR